MPAAAEQVASTAFILRYRGALYVLANVTFCLLSGWGYTIADVSLGRPIYLCGLFALCSVPILLLRAYNDRFALLGIFMAEYFLLFGMQDFLSLFMSTPLSATTDFLTPAEWLILAGGVMALLGYVVAARSVPLAASAHVSSDWPPRTILMAGLAFTVGGSMAFAYFHLVAVTVNTNKATTQAFASMGPILTFIVMLGQLLRPLGVLILSYGYARYRTFFWFALILAILVSQIVLGFLGDTKSFALQAGALIILTRMLIDNRLPRAWIIAAAAGTVILFPLFQAYRTEVAGERGMNRAQAVQNLGKVIDIVLGARDKVTEGKPGVRSQTFFERASLKGNVELVVARAGVDTPFQLGHTLIDLPLAFVPRLIWPDKPTVPAGQLFNKVVVGGEGDTFISPSHLGELYWNFSWPGAMVGMFLIGSLAGFIGAKTSLAEVKSVTRLLVLLATVDGMCLGFEGSIAIAYVVLVRSLAAAGILHMLLARRGIAGEAVRVSSDKGGAVNLHPVARFPNLMR